uniref:AB hydrolase-1 domain-containing protein n=1 Tax=Monopterus albus TaxID=43700 RepID=A0A3Q3KN59_MONAL
MSDLDAMILFIIAEGTLVIPILAFVASFFLWPSALIKVYYWYWRTTLGLQVRYADCGGYRFCYSYRGKPGKRPSILILHGFSAHKDTWLTVVKYLPKHLHIVCVDMPGHEGTRRTNREDYSIQGQARRIHQFVETIGLNRKLFYLLGISMGGVWSVTLRVCVCVCARGKYGKFLQDLEHSNYTLNNPLIPTTPEEMEDMLRLCSHVRFKIPQQILQGLIDARQPHNTFYKEVFMEIVGQSKYALHQHLHLITAPLQVIWGKQDQTAELIPGATVIAGVFPGCRVDLLDNCGHAVVMERPLQTAELILDFIIMQQDAMDKNALGQ